ncbi:hypothetical protein Q8F55_008163 [Vanrija albida]|uniref:Uncharacterized protein n=1 Tax=Vanrija albida TaxID=181172 RepID=A0ABR3PVK5_9TREE
MLLAAAALVLPLAAASSGHVLFPTAADWWINDHSTPAYLVASFTPTLAQQYHVRINLTHASLDPPFDFSANAGPEGVDLGTLPAGVEKQWVVWARGSPYVGQGYALELEYSDGTVVRSGEFEIRPAGSAVTEAPSVGAPAATKAVLAAQVPAALAAQPPVILAAGVSSGESVPAPEASVAPAKASGAARVAALSPALALLAAAAYLL